MRVALAWRWKHGTRESCTADAAVRNLDACFAPLAGEPLTSRTHEAGDHCFASVELTTTGFEAPFYEDGESGWAFATEYPLNGARLAGVPAGDGTLRALALGLRRDPAALLAELYPPFVLFGYDRRTGELTIHNDGLGQGQLFEYEDGDVWAVSNRIGAFRALGIKLEPAPMEWAVRFTLGWFPLDTSGYVNVRHVSPGTRLTISSNRVRRERTDVITRWVHPEERTPDECAELAQASIATYLEDVRPLAPCPTVGLSGGWDSRAVTSVMRAQGAEFELRVRGHPERMDVRISTELARIAGLPLRVKTRGGYPPDNAADCGTCIKRALRWQGGHMDTLKHKTFLARRPHLGRGVVNVMGQHSGIGKADFAVLIGADELQPDAFESSLVESLVGDVPFVFQPGTTDQVRSFITRAYREADSYGLVDLHRLHFFFLHEYTRRWGGATVNAQAGVVLTPFLNPDFIRAAYAYPPAGIPKKPFHRHITETYAPDWARVVYTDQAKKSDVADFAPPIITASQIEEDVPEWRAGRVYGKYSQNRYWKKVGWPLVADALAEEGWWNEIFRPGESKRDWYKPKGVADALVICQMLEGALWHESAPA